MDEIKHQRHFYARVAQILRIIDLAKAERKISFEHTAEIGKMLAEMHSLFIQMNNAVVDVKAPDIVEGDILLQTVSHSLNTIFSYRMPANCSIFKVAGTFTHWISYLKPFPRPLDSLPITYRYFSNEVFSIFLANCLISKDERFPKGLMKLTRHFYIDFIEELRYGDISPLSLSLVYEAITYQSHPQR